MVRRLQDTPGYTDNPVATPAQQSEGDSTPVQEGSPPPSSSSGTASVTPGEAVQAQSQPGAADAPTDVVSDTATVAGDALNVIADELAPEPTPAEPTLPWAGYSNKLTGITGTPLANLSPQPRVRQTINNAAKTTYTRPDGTEYESVLAKITHRDEDTPVHVQRIVDLHKKSPESFELSGDKLVDRTSEGSNWNFGSMTADSLVIHHTAGRPTVDGTIQTFKDRGYPAHFIIDRDGSVVQVLGLDQRGQHTKNSEVPGLDINNGNSWGVEIIARNDEDVNDAQVQAAIGLAKFLNKERGMPLDRVVGHGHINSHKEKTEGATVISALARINSA